MFTGQREREREREKERERLRERRERERGRERELHACASRECGRVESLSVPHSFSQSVSQSACVIIVFIVCPIN